MQYTDSMDFEHEKFFPCPHCGERISMLLEELYGSQSYIEDCEVCCKPIRISYSVADEGGIENVDVQPG